MVKRLKAIEADLGTYSVANAAGRTLKCFACGGNHHVKDCPDAVKKAAFLRRRKDKFEKSQSQFGAQASEKSRYQFGTQAAGHSQPGTQKGPAFKANAGFSTSAAKNSDDGESWVFRPTVALAAAGLPPPVDPSEEKVSKPIVVKVQRATHSETLTLATVPEPQVFVANMAKSTISASGFELPPGRHHALMDGGTNVHNTPVDITGLPGYVQLSTPLRVDLGDEKAEPMLLIGKCPLWNGLRDVYYAPSARTTLVAEQLLHAQGYGVTRTTDGTMLVCSPEGRNLFKIPISKNMLLEFDLPDDGGLLPPRLQANMRGGEIKNRAMEAHLRLAHANWDVLKALNASGAFQPRSPSHISILSASVSTVHWRRPSERSSLVKPGANRSMFGNSSPWMLLPFLPTKAWVVRSICLYFGTKRVVLSWRKQ